MGISLKLLDKDVLKKLKGTSYSILALIILQFLVPQKFYQSLDYELLFSYYKFKQDKVPSKNIVHVMVDDKTVESFGWPIPRDLYAYVISIAKASGAKAVGMDVLFLDPPPKEGSDDLLKKVLSAKNFPVVFAEELVALKVGAGQDSVAEFSRPPIYTDASSGHIVVNTTKKGIPVNIYHQVQVQKGNKSLQSFSSELIHPDLQSFEGPDPMLISIKKDMGLFNEISLVDLLGKMNDAEKLKGLMAELKDKYIVVGLTSASIGDFSASALGGNWPSVYIHLNAMENMLNKEFIKWKSGKTIWAFLVSLLIAFLVFSLSPLRSVFCFLVILFCSYFYFYNQLSQSLVFLPATHWFMSLVTSFAVQNVQNAYQKDKQGRFLKKAFSSYMSPNLLDKLLKDPSALILAGERKTITIFFSDIKGYTNLSNNFPPSEILTLLREYLNEMVNIIMEFGGTVDKIMGDGIMALFNAPLNVEEHEENALLCSVKMQETMIQLQKKWAAEGKVGLQIRIGLATGKVFVGNLGGEQHFEYTAVGPSVNLAARLEASAPPGGVLVSRETYLGTKEKYLYQPIEGLRLKGYGTSYTAYLFKSPKVQEEEISKSHLGDRKDHRWIAFIPALVEIGDSTFDIQLENLSQSGALIRSKTNLIVGNQYDLKINSTDILKTFNMDYRAFKDQKNLNIYGRAVWNKDSPGWQLYGFEFENRRGGGSLREILDLLKEYQLKKLESEPTLLKDQEYSQLMEQAYNLGKDEVSGDFDSFGLPRSWGEALGQEPEPGNIKLANNHSIHPGAIKLLINQSLELINNFGVDVIFCMFEIKSLSMLENTLESEVFNKLIFAFEECLLKKVRKSDNLTFFLPGHCFVIFNHIPYKAFINLSNRIRQDLEKIEIESENGHFEALVGLKSFKPLKDEALEPNEVFKAFYVNETKARDGWVQWI